MSDTTTILVKCRLEKGDKYLGLSQMSRFSKELFDRGFIVHAPGHDTSILSYVANTDFEFIIEVRNKPENK